MQRLAFIGLATALLGCGGADSKVVSAAAPTHLAGGATSFASRRQTFWVEVVFVGGVPQVGNTASAHLRFLRHPDGQPAAAPSSVTAQIYMPAHTHRPQAVQVSRTDALPPHVVHLSEIAVGMAGTWALAIDATIDGVTDQVDVPFEVP